MKEYNKSFCPEDTSVPVGYPRIPGSVFPNHYAFMFLYAPAFAFAEVPGAKAYCFEAKDKDGRLHVFRDTQPDRPLSQIWNELPVGTVSLKVIGEDENGKAVGIAGNRTFYKKAQFRPGSYEKKKRSYRENVRLMLDNRFRSAEITELLAGRTPKFEYPFNYPTKQFAALIGGMKRRAILFPEAKEESLCAIVATADLLLSMSEARGTALAGFTPTYYLNSSPEDGQKTTMLIYPANGITAFLDAFEASRDPKYLAAAELGAETFMKMQGEDGTWPLLVSVPDGIPVKPNRCMPFAHIEAFDRLYAVTGNTAYRNAADRAFGYIERGPLIDWNWEGQFEDTPVAQPYRNLTEHDACSTAIFLIQHYPGDTRRIAVARELLRFAEDLFVNWEKPFGDGNILYPERGAGDYNHYWDIDEWIMPSVMEQYGCFTPVDASAAKLIRTYLALYRAEGNCLDLEKAAVLGDAITRMTDEQGLESTWWTKKYLGKDVWPNCMLDCEEALEELISYVSEEDI